MSSFTDTRRCLHSQTHDEVFIHRHTTMSSFTDTQRCLHSQTHDNVFIHRHMTMSSFTDTQRCLHSQTHDDVFIHRHMTMSSFTDTCSLTFTDQSFRVENTEKSTIIYNYTYTLFFPTSSIHSFILV